MLCGFNGSILQRGYEILHSIFNVINKEQREKYKRRTKIIMIWALINLLISLLLLCFQLFLDLFFEFTFMIIISSIILLIILLKSLKQFRNFKKYHFIAYLVLFCYLIMATILFIYGYSIFKGYLLDVYSYFMIFSLFSIMTLIFIYIFYSLFTFKPEQEDEKIIEDKSNWKKKTIRKK